MEVSAGDLLYASTLQSSRLLSTVSEFTLTETRIQPVERSWWLYYQMVGEPSRIQNSNPGLT